MSIKISRKIAAIPPSATMAIDGKAKALQAAGHDVVSFGAGEPDFDTPTPIKDAAKAALDAGAAKYTPVAGEAALRKAISAKYKRDYGLDYTAEETIVTCGGKHALYQIFLSILEPGDEVLIPAPYWVSYPPMVELADGVPVIVPTDESTGFAATAEMLAAKITPKTRAIVLNSPSNPTGAAYSRAQLADIARLVIERDLVMVSDEIYEHLVYDGFEFVSFPTLDPRLKERAILVSGVSKTYAMTGWRIGYALAPAPVIKAMANLQSQSTSGMTTVAQRAATFALNADHAIWQEMFQAFSRRRRLMLDLLAAMPGVTCFPPQGAFYVFPNFSAHFGKNAGDKAITDSFSLCEYLLDAVKVAAVPGGAFGADANIRLSYATSDELIREGLARIGRALADLR